VDGAGIAGHTFELREAAHANWVRSVEVTSVYGRFDLKAEFQPGVNILYGKNGTGKTTLLHILANILNEEYARFAFLLFDSIIVELEGLVISLKRTQKSGEAEITVKVKGQQILTFPVQKIQKWVLDPERYQYQAGIGQLSRNSRIVLRTHYCPLPTFRLFVR